MVCKEITDKKIWEDFLLGCKERTFLQSWNWGELQKAMGHKIWRLEVCENNGCPISIILAVKVVARRGTFLLVQHGPNMINPKQIQNSKLEILNTILTELKRIAKEEGCSFIRIASLSERNEENIKMFKDLGFREASMHASAYEATWKLDIAPSEEELLANMRKTTRYLIKQAEKNTDIAIEKSNRPSDLEIYQRLNQEVSRRQRFAPFSANFIKNEFEVFSSDNEAMLFLGKYKGEVAAGALVIFWSGVGFYHQAASLAKYSKFSIPYLLQWEAIKEAKRRGCKLYDFWGYIDPKAYSGHPWAGPTLFKMGFGGRAYEYVKTQDLPLSRKYWLTYIFEKLRSKKRGL
ncbi:MAG: peptidoglycan bridge formation glycyltransferase FemA/FemB family protein [Candidatus Nealsonbacteria bacterium]|nr:peptidoglycan bridge formation glycyltransferase FemA/FemB family protein [Candidatus Nealsonbacteria bacterium]